MANNRFQHKRSTVSGVSPTTSDIAMAELAINVADRKLFTSNGTSVFELGSNLVNLSVTGNANIKAIIANGSLGTANQILTSNGSAIYWSTSTSSGFSNGQSISVNNFVITGAFTANNSNGTSGQVLTSNGTGVYWSTSSGGTTINKVVAMTILFGR